VVITGEGGSYIEPSLEQVVRMKSSYGKMHGSTAIVAEFKMILPKELMKRPQATGGVVNGYFKLGAIVMVQIWKN
jgi:hypothetical protein